MSDEKTEDIWVRIENSNLDNILRMRFEQLYKSTDMTADMKLKEKLWDFYLQGGKDLCELFNRALPRK